MMASDESSLPVGLVFSRCSTSHLEPFIQPSQLAIRTTFIVSAPTKTVVSTRVVIETSHSTPAMIQEASESTTEAMQLRTARSCATTSIADTQIE